MWLRKNRMNRNCGRDANVFIYLLKEMHICRDNDICDHAKLKGLAMEDIVVHMFQSKNATIQKDLFLFPHTMRFN